MDINVKKEQQEEEKELPKTTKQLFDLMPIPFTESSLQTHKDPVIEKQKLQQIKFSSQINNNSNNSIKLCQYCKTWSCVECLNNRCRSCCCVYCIEDKNSCSFHQLFNNDLNNNGSNDNSPNNNSSNNNSSNNNINNNGSNSNIKNNSSNDNSSNNNSLNNNNGPNNSSLKFSSSNSVNNNIFNNNSINKIGLNNNTNNNTNNNNNIENNILNNNINININNENNFSEKRWSTEDDNKLMEIVNQNGTKSWALISSNFKDKSLIECRERWLLLCDANKSVNNSGSKRKHSQNNNTISISPLNNSKNKYIKITNSSKNNNTLDSSNNSNNNYTTTTTTTNTTSNINSVSNSALVDHSNEVFVESLNSSSSNNNNNNNIININKTSITQNDYHGTTTPTLELSSPIHSPTKSPESDSLINKKKLILEMPKDQRFHILEKKRNLWAKIMSIKQKLNESPNLQHEDQVKYTNYQNKIKDYSEKYQKLLNSYHHCAEKIKQLKLESESELELKLEMNNQNGRNSNIVFGSNSKNNNDSNYNKYKNSTNSSANNNILELDYNNNNNTKNETANTTISNNNNVNSNNNNLRSNSNKYNNNSNANNSNNNNTTTTTSNSKSGGKGVMEASFNSTAQDLDQNVYSAIQFLELIKNSLRFQYQQIDELFAAQIKYLQNNKQ